jgi:small subunit ribosomal protein S16
MSVKIRLTRHGAKKHAFYRIVVKDSRAPRDGGFIEQIGTYDPAPKPEKVDVKRDKLEKWLERGAVPSDTVSQLLKRAGLPRRATKRGKPSATGEGAAA